MLYPLRNSIRCIGILTVGATLVAVSSLEARDYQFVTTSLPHYHVTTHILGTSPLGEFLSLDLVRRRLYGLGNLVIDLDRDTIVDSLPFPAAGGYALAPDVGRGLTRKGMLFDLTTRAAGETIDHPADDAIYEPVTHRAFLLDNITTVIDMTTGKQVARVALGDVSWGAADGHGALFIGLEKPAVVIQVNAASVQIERRFAVPGCTNAQGMAMDRRTRRLFVGCREGLGVVNADNGHLVTVLPMPGQDENHDFDPARKLIFYLAGGKLTIVHEEGPDTYRIVQQLAISGSAVVVDPKTHKVYALGFDTDKHVTQVTVAAPDK